MRSLAVLAVLMLLPLPAMAQEDCTGASARLRALTTKYRATMTDLRSTQGMATRSPGSEEAAMRIQRQLAASQREAREQRARMLEVYRVLVEGDCGAYDEDGYQRTAAEFRRLDNEELSMMAGVGAGPRRAAP